MFSSLPNARSVPRSPQKLVPLCQLLEHLQQLCQTQSTGSLYLVSAEQHAGSFALNRGQIVGVKYACQQGERALEMMQGLTQVSYRFTEKAIAIADFQSLPKTDEILTQLGWGVEQIPPEQKQKPQRSPQVLPPRLASPSSEGSPPPPPPQSSLRAVSQFSTPQLASVPQFSAPQFSEQQVLEQQVSESQPVKLQKILEPSQQAALEHLTTAYLGPVAKLILQKTMHQTDDLDTVIQLLRRRIRDPKEAAEFVREAYELC